MLLLFAFSVKLYNRIYIFVPLDNFTALTRIKLHNKGVTQAPEKHSFGKCNWVDTRYDNSSAFRIE